MRAGDLDFGHVLLTAEGRRFAVFEVRAAGSMSRSIHHARVPEGCVQVSARSTDGQRSYMCELFTLEQDVVVVR